MSESMDVDQKPVLMRENNLIPWVEKYRPQVFDEIVGNEDIVDKLRSFSECGNLPNILISGSPGTGKTTTILCLARKLLGAQMKDAVLELNASNERGIEVVRDKIKGFAQSKVTLPPNRHKIIILDEADSMTTGAQQALRRTMEIYSSTTRFALACNTSDKIIEPIQSRCAHVRFNKLTESQIKRRILEICKLENVDYTEDGIEAILFTAQGDLRQAINNLQSTHDGFGKVNNENVFKVCDEPHPNTVREMLKYCLENRFDDAYQKMKHLWNLGYSSQDIISNIFNVCKIYDMPENVKMEYIKEIGVANLRMNKGIKSLLQFSGLLVRLCKKSQA